MAIISSFFDSKNSILKKLLNWIAFSKKISTLNWQCQFDVWPWIAKGSCVHLLPPKNIEWLCLLAWIRRSRWLFAVQPDPGWGIHRPVVQLLQVWAWSRHWTHTLSGNQGKKPWKTRIFNFLTQASPCCTSMLSL